MAKKTSTVEEIAPEDVQDLNDVLEGDEDEETTSVVRPKDLASELNIDPKNLRNFLRKEFPRPSGEKNTSWVLTEAQVEAARAKFAESEEDEVEVDETDSEE